MKPPPSGKRAAVGVLRQVSPTLHHKFLRWRFQAKLPAVYRSGAPLAFTMPGREAGFFSHFFQVIGAIDFCRSLGHTLILDFRGGPYADNDRTENWWTYYFEPDPFLFGQAASTDVLVAHAEREAFARYGANLAPAVANEIMSAIQVRSPIRDKVDSFVADHFRGSKVIGIHYRGTDKVEKEAVRVPYEYVASQVDRQDASAQLFVAADEAAFLAYMVEHFGDRVFFLDALRSDDGAPIHSMAGSQGLGYRAGEDALIDCLLLSRCQRLLRTDSNLSKACSVFNPKQPAVDLTREFSREAQRTAQQNSRPH